MALRLSTGLRDKLLEGTQGFKQLFTDGVMDLYTGTQPSSADGIETGTLLVRITVSAATAGSGGTGGGTASTAAGLDFGTAANGVLSKNADTWSGTGANTGEAGWFRFYENNIYKGTSSTAIRFDGNCGLSGSDLNFDDLTVTATVVETINSFSITLPAY